MRGVEREILERKRKERKIINIWYLNNLSFWTQAECLIKSNFKQASSRRRRRRRRRRVII